ncbi:MAG: hypothetical protein EB015_19480, partial [Methylocystaceae bacterium]|nr:hypothetical protein [Methylocystaceae bacterium]
MRLYAQVNGASPALSDAIKGAVVERLTVFGHDDVRAAGDLAGVRRAYGRHFAVLGVDKPDLGDDAAILRQVNTKLAEADLTMASIMTYYADEAPRLLGPLHREALEAIEAKLDTLAAPEPLEVDTFVQFVNHLRAFHTALSPDNPAAAKVKMTALLGQITPFLPAGMELAGIARIYGEIGHENDKALLSEVLAGVVRDHFLRADVEVAGFPDLVAAHEAALRTLAADVALPIADKLGPLVEAMDTPAALLDAHRDLGNLGEDAEVKAVLTSLLSVLAGEDPSDDADAYIAFVTGFHAAYTALSPNGFAVIGAAKLPDNLSLEAVRRINTGLAGNALALASVRPILIRRVLVSLDARATLTDIVQTYVPVLAALGLDRPAALIQLKDNGILHSRLSDNPAGLAEQFRVLVGDHAEDDQAALRDLFLAALTDQAQVLPANMDNDALQARIQSFLDASLTISGDAWDPTRDPVLIAVMRPIAESLAPQACVDLYTYLVRRDAGLV